MGPLTPEQQIDSLKKLIVQKASQGEPFEKLSDQYGMDGNTLAATLGSREYFPQEFQDAVKAHKLGDIFFVDMPEKQWYYVVKKTHNDRVKKEMT